VVVGVVVVTSCGSGRGRGCGRGGAPGAAAAALGATVDADVLASSAASAKRSSAQIGAAVAFTDVADELCRHACCTCTTLCSCADCNLAASSACREDAVAESWQVVGEAARRSVASLRAHEFHRGRRLCE